MRAGSSVTRRYTPGWSRFQNETSWEIEMVTMGNLPEVVSREEWLAARMELLVRRRS